MQNNIEPNSPGWAVSHNGLQCFSNTEFCVWKTIGYTHVNAQFGRTAVYTFLNTDQFRCITAE